MKILVITREYPPYILGGLSYHLKHLYNNISKKGHDVHILAGACRASEYSTQHIEEDISIEYLPFKRMRFHRFRFSWHIYHKLQRINLSEFDICFTHTPLPFSMPLPTIWKIHDCQYAEKKFVNSPQRSLRDYLDDRYDKVRKTIDQRSYNSCDHSIFISKLMKECHTNIFNVRRNSVIYNGVDPEVFYPRKVSKKDYFLFVGSIERKGLSKIKTLASRSDVPIKVAGMTDPDHENMDGLGRINQEELAKRYSEARVTIHPAQFEPFGNVILESISCGTPVVASKMCGAIEILNDDCSVRMEDHTTILEAAKTAMSLRPEDCIELARNHTWEQVASRTMTTASTIS